MSFRQNLEYFYQKTGTYDEQIPVLVMNKIMSHNNPSLCAEIDTEIFSVNKEILKQKLLLNIPQQRVPFIPFSKKQEQQEEEFEFLFKKIKHFYQMSNNEFNNIKALYIEQFKDKKKLLYYFKFFGIPKKQYKNYGIEFEQQKKTLGDYY